MARRYAAAGTALGAKFQVNTTTANDQTNPSLAMDADGNFLVTWEGNGTGDTAGVFGQKFDAAGAKVGGQFLVNQTTTNTQHMASAALLDPDNFVVVWSGQGPGDTSGVFARQFGTANIPPVITSDGGGPRAAISIAENTTAVTTVTATDADLPAQTLTYSISGGADAAKFTINGSTGALSFLAAPDFEAPTDAGANNIYDVTVQVSDGTLTDTQAIAVTVTAVNDNSPVISSNGGGASAAVSIAENTATVTTVTATDADLPAQPLTYSITGGADAARFTIDGATGVLSFVAAPNFEFPADVGGDNVYDLTVQVVDGAGGTDSQDLAVTVTGVVDGKVLYLNGQNDADGPPFSELSTVVPNAPTLVNYDSARNAEPGLTINKGGDVAGVNETDDTKHHTWVISGPTQLTNQSVQLIFWSDITAGMDAGQTVDIPRGKNATVTGYLLDLPTATSETGGTILATNSVVDESWGDGFVWEQKTIDFGVVNYAVAPGRHLAVKLVVHSASGDDMWLAYDTINFTSRVEVSGPNTAPSITSDGGEPTAAVSVAENSLSGDHRHRHRCRPAGANADLLDLRRGGCGEVRDRRFDGRAEFRLGTGLRSAPTDAGANNIYDVTVQVSDGTLTDTQAIAVTVTAVNDNDPVITSNGGGATAAISVAENTTAVTTVTATDADLPAQTLTYSISGGADAAKFTINSATGCSELPRGPELRSADGRRGEQCLRRDGPGQ